MTAQTELRAVATVTQGPRKDCETRDMSPGSSLAKLCPLPLGSQRVGLFFQISLLRLDSTYNGFYISDMSCNLKGLMFVTCREIFGDHVQCAPRTPSNGLRSKHADSFRSRVQPQLLRATIQQLGTGSLSCVWHWDRPGRWAER